MRPAERPSPAVPTSRHDSTGIGHVNLPCQLYCNHGSHAILPCQLDCNHGGRAPWPFQVQVSRRLVLSARALRRCFNRVVTGQDLGKT